MAFPRLWRTRPHSIHTRSMKILLCTKESRLRASPRHSGQGVFLFFIHRSAAQEAQSAAEIIVPDGLIGNNSRILSEYYVFHGKCSKNMNAYGGFTPLLGLPKNVITPELVLRHQRYQRRGGMGGQAHVPPDLTCPVNSYPDKRNYPERPMVIHHGCLSP
jgi:hypothetical protein